MWDDNSPSSPFPSSDATVPASMKKQAKVAEGEDERPEIDRVRLREILLDSIDSSSIIWGKKLLRVERDSTGGKGKHTLIFTDGSQESGIDLVIGADGAWSKVRPLLTDSKPFYSGITALEIWATDVESRPEYEWLGGWAGEGSCFMFDEGRAVIAQRNGEKGHEGVRIYAAMRVPETWVEECGIEWGDKEGAKRKVVEGYFGDCGEDIKRAVMDGRDEVIVRKLWMLPVGLKWEGVPGVTLLGGCGAFDDAVCRGWG